MAFVSVGKASDVPEGSVEIRDAEDREIAVCRANGELYAFENLCTHDDGRWTRGSLTASKSYARGTWPASTSARVK